MFIHIDTIIPINPFACNFKCFLLHTAIGNKSLFFQQWIFGIQESDPYSSMSLFYSLASNVQNNVSVISHFIFVAFIEAKFLRRVFTSKYSQQNNPHRRWSIRLIENTHCILLPGDISDFWFVSSFVCLCYSQINPDLPKFSMASNKRFESQCLS